ncbi:Leucine-rich repeat-containing protein 57 [Spatholobus suberectus]|nr:Leucine-rich repeat-containing protein 57 [Spatholobus suberectus]
MPTQLPKFIGKLQNLETLDIRRTKVKEMPKEICKLRKLRHLLGDDVKLFQLKNGLGGMTSLQTLRHQLRELSLGPLRNLKSIIIDKGALHSLETLEIWKIPKLKTVPPGIQHLEKLEVLDINFMSTEFNECIAPDGGPEHPIIQHVPLDLLFGAWIKRMRK